MSDSAHAEVHGGCQPAVEADLIHAHLPPAGRGPVVEERQHELLFELVRPLADKEHPRNVGLPRLHHSGVEVLQGCSELIWPYGVRLSAACHENSAISAAVAMAGVHLYRRARPHVE